MQAADAQTAWFGSGNGGGGQVEAHVHAHTHGYGNGFGYAGGNAGGEFEGPVRPHTNPKLPVATDEVQEWAYGFGFPDCSFEGMARFFDDLGPLPILEE
jgi:hypothetical protein